MKALHPRLAKLKADELCKQIRNDGGIYIKRYSRINAAGTLMKIKLWGINNFWRKRFDGTFLSEYFKTAEIKHNWIDARKLYGDFVYADSFVFWLPLRSKKSVV